MLASERKNLANHELQLLAHHNSTKWGNSITTFATYSVQGNLFCKAYAIDSEDQDLRARVSDAYMAKSALPASEYVVRYDKVISSKRTWYCIFDKFCKHGHLVHLKDFLSESLRTPIYTDTYAQFAVEDQQTAIRIVTSAVKSFNIVTLQAKTEPDYPKICMKLRLKGVFVDGTLPNDPIVRLSGFYLSDTIRNFNESQYWIPAKRGSKARLVWFLGKMLYYLLGDKQLLQIPEYEDDVNTSIRTEDITHLTRANPRMKSLLQRCLITKDVSWPDFVYELEECYKGNAPNHTRASTESRPQFVLEEELEGSASKEVSLSINAAHEKVSPVQPNPETLVPVAKIVQPTSNNQIAEMNTSMNKSSGSAGTQVGKIDKTKPVTLTTQITVTQLKLRNRLIAELYRLRLSANILFNSLSKQIEKHLTTSQDANELMALFHFYQMILQKYRFAVTSFKMDVEKRRFPDIDLSVTDEDWKYALAADPFQSKMEEFSSKVLNSIQDARDRLFQTLASANHRNPDLLPKSFLGIVLNSNSVMTDVKKVNVYLKNSWISCLEHFQNARGRLQPDTVDWYQRWLLFGYYMLKGPLFTPLTESFKLDTVAIGDDDPSVVSDFTKLRDEIKAQQPKLQEAFLEMQKALPNEYLRQEEWRISQEAANSKS